MDGYTLININGYVAFWLNVIFFLYRGIWFVSASMAFNVLSLTRVVLSSLENVTLVSLTVSSMLSFMNLFTNLWALFVLVQEQIITAKKAVMTKYRMILINPQGYF